MQAQTVTLQIDPVASVKVGGGIDTVITGWLLEISGYVGTAVSQPESALRIMSLMYLWIPVVLEILIMLVLSRMNVEETNEKLRNAL